MVVLAGLQPSQALGSMGPWKEPLAKTEQPMPKAEAPQDQLELSSKARALSRQPQETKQTQPDFGRFQLGGPEPLPFGPDLNATILNRIPGDGIREAQHGVELGHQPARGLNILA